MLKTFLLLKKVLEAKWSFRALKKAEVLLYGVQTTRSILNILDEKKCEFFYTGGGKYSRYQLNLRIVLRTFLSSGFKNFRKNYKKNYISFINPKYAICLANHDLSFSEIKKFKKDLITIVIQQGDYGPQDYEALKQKKIEKNSIDFFFSYGETHSRVLKKYFINTKFIEIGSFKNNLYQFNDKSHFDEIIFISAYKRELGFPKYERVILKLLERYCKKRNLKLGIITRYGNFVKPECVKKVEKEYKRHLKYDISKFYRRNDYNSIYQDISKNNVFIFCETSAGYEVMARGKRVAKFAVSFPISQHSLPVSASPGGIQVVTRPFIYPNKVATEGPFWTEKLTKEKFIKIMNYIVNTDEEDWQNTLKKHLSNFIKYDPNNYILLKEFKLLGVPLKK